MNEARNRKKKSTFPRNGARATGGRGPIALYAVVLVLLFGDVLFLGRTLDPYPYVPGTTAPSAPGYKGPSFCNDAGAVVWAFQPWNRLVHHELFEEGAIPLWNPYQATGVPLAANFQSGVFSPLQWPFFLFDSPGWWDLLFVLRLLLAGAFTFLFLRRIGLDSLPAWLGGLAYMLTGYLIDYINMNHLGVPVLLPAGFYFLESWRRTARPVHLVGTVAALALAVLVGMPESALLSWILIGTFIAFQLVAHRSRPAEWIRLGWPFALAALVSAILLVPGLEYLSLCHSKHFVIDWGVQSLPLETAVGYLVPYFFGAPGPLGWHSVYDKGFHVPSGVGVVTSVLALIGFGFSRTRLRWFFGIYATVALLKIFGAPIVDMVGYLPLLHMVIFTKYLQPSVAFCVAVLAAFGISELRREVQRGTALMVLGGLMVAICAGFSLFHLDGIVHAPLAPVKYAVIGYILLAALMGTGAAALGWMHKRGFRHSTALIFGLAMLELIFLAARIHPQRRMEEPDKGEWVTEARSRGLGGFRIIGDHPLFPNTASGVQIADLRILDPILPRNLAGALEKLTGQPLHSRFSFREFDAYEHPALDLLGVRYVVSGRDIRNLLLRQRPAEPADRLWTEETTGRRIQMLQLRPGGSYEFTAPAPSTELLLLAQATERSASIRLGRDDGIVAEKDLQPGFQMSALDQAVHQPPTPTRFRLEVEAESKVFAAVVLKESLGNPVLIPLAQQAGFHLFERPESLPTAFVTKGDWLDQDFAPDQLTRQEVSAAVSGVAEIRHRSANRLFLSVSSREAGMLFISQTYYPGWTALVNGREAELRQIASFMTAVDIPAGTSQVRLEYSPDSVKLGAGVTVAGLLLTLLTAWRLRGSPAWRVP